MRSQLKKKLIFDDITHLSVIHGKKLAITADSPEVLYQHYCDKIIYLLEQLNKLNLLEHPCEIQSVCGEITELKKKSVALALKHRF